MSIESIFTSFKVEIKKESDIKTKLNEFENEIVSKLSLIKSRYSKLTEIQPLDLFNEYYAEESFMEASFEDEMAGSEMVQETNINKLKELKMIYHDSVFQLNSIECKSILKDRISHKINEEVFQIILLNRYFKAVGNIFHLALKSAGDISYPIISDSERIGLIITPEEISSLLDISSVNYNDYLLSLLKVIEEIVNYTTQSIILISISSNSNNDHGYDNSTIQKQYALSIVNQSVIQNLQIGFETLDLKNDNLRRKFDGLKYNLKKINSIVYDLCLRNLIVQKITIT